MLKKILQNISDSLLFYKDGNGNYVFKTYCCEKYTGAAYNIDIPKNVVGKALEYKMDLDKNLKRLRIISFILLYLLFIHQAFSFFKLYFLIILFIIISNIGKFICSRNYGRYLFEHFGKYKLIDFNPPYKDGTVAKNIRIYFVKGFAICILLTVYFLPMLFIPKMLNHTLLKDNENFTSKILTKAYLSIYPKTKKVYDVKAIYDYKRQNYEGVLTDYRTSLKINGKSFDNKDDIRLANLMLIKKWLTNPNDAIDEYNEIITRKHLTTSQATKMLWIRSMFEVENKIDYTVQTNYNDLLESVNPKETTNIFYIKCDKAYLAYVAKNYDSALTLYNEVINLAENNKQQFKKDLPTLFVERAYTKLRLGDSLGADLDFANSGLSDETIEQSEPKISNQDFWIENF